MGKKKSGARGTGSAGKGNRDLTVRVKTAKGRKLSSTLWLQRQLNDPYVLAAQREGYRSRAVYKLQEIDDKYKLLKPGMRIIDLGAAPGGWSQLCAKRVKAAKTDGQVVAVDLQEMDPIPDVTTILCDFDEDDAPDRIKALMEGHTADGVISDMAAQSTGHKGTDHIRIIALCELAHDFAREILAPEGFFLAKVLQGGTENTLLAALKKDFRTVRHVKPKASRADSSELYVLATGFRGNEENEKKQ